MKRANPSGPANLRTSVRFSILICNVVSPQVVCDQLKVTLTGKLKLFKGAGAGAHCTESVVWNGLAFAPALTPVGSASIVTAWTTLLSCASVCLASLID